MTKLSFPFSAEKIRALTAGGAVLLSGVCSPGARRSRRFNVRTTSGIELFQRPKMSQVEAA